jgi:predicted nucleic acid-binding protein
MAELVYGTRSVMSAVRAFLARIVVHPWMRQRPSHTLAFVFSRSGEDGAGVFDIMIAAHADALGATLVTNDAGSTDWRSVLKIGSW